MTRRQSKRPDGLPKPRRRPARPPLARAERALLSHATHDENGIPMIDVVLGTTRVEGTLSIRATSPNAKRPLLFFQVIRSDEELVGDFRANLTGHQMRALHDALGIALQEATRRRMIR